MSTDKRTDYSSDVVPFGPIAAAASTLIKEVVSGDAIDDDVIDAGDDEEGGDANVPLHLKVKGQDGCFDAKRVCETQTPAEVNIQDGAVIGAGEVLLEGTFKRLQGQTGELEDIGALLTAD